MKEIDLKVPDIGDTDEIEIVQWHKKPGDEFIAGEEICDLVTDKAAFSLEAPEKGKLMQILVQNKSKVKVGQLVGKALIEG